MATNEVLAVIGTATFANDFKHSPSFESPLQSKTWHIPAGTYNLERCRSRFGGEYIRLVLRGTVIGSWWGAKSYPDEIGEESEVMVQLRDYEVGLAVEGLRSFTLLDRAKVERV